MLIRDLLEELQKHGEENIHFCLVNEDGITKRLEPANIDSRFIYKLKGIGGGSTNTIIFGLTEDA